MSSQNGVLIFHSLLSEEKISGRNISTFKLSSPIIYNGREIDVLELPSPKDWSEYKKWFEHVEFVITESFDVFMGKYPQLDFITKDLVKENNPDIKIQYDNCSVKFHEQTLEEVIKEEQLWKL